ncbi:hypothetical protein B0H14DRAFT_2579210 [Mycena olivaceomarginata]|nr:hypothetical protein B0H14DRAFT_2579210 [Mycena olivaceomarginata]
MPKGSDLASYMQYPALKLAEFRRVCGMHGRITQPSRPLHVRDWLPQPPSSIRNAGRLPQHLLLCPISGHCDSDLEHSRPPQPATIASFLRRLVFPVGNTPGARSGLQEVHPCFCAAHDVSLHVTSVCVNTTLEDVEALATLYMVLPSATSMDLCFSSAAAIAALGCRIVPFRSAVLPELKQVIVVDNEWEELHVALRRRRSLCPIYGLKVMVVSQDQYTGDELEEHSEGPAPITDTFYGPASRGNIEKVVDSVVVIDPEPVQPYYY